jgi:hypothetical protein
MLANTRRISPWVAVAGLLLMLGAPSSAFGQKGRKISVGDDPSLKGKDGSPKLVLVEVADFQ